MTGCLGDVHMAERPKLEPAVPRAVRGRWASARATAETIASTEAQSSSAASERGSVSSREPRPAAVLRSQPAGEPVPQRDVRQFVSTHYL